MAFAITHHILLRRDVPGTCLISQELAHRRETSFECSLAPGHFKEFHSLWWVVLLGLSFPSLESIRIQLDGLYIVILKHVRIHFMYVNILYSIYTYIYVYIHYMHVDCKWLYITNVNNDVVNRYNQKIQTEHTFKTTSIDMSFNMPSSCAVSTHPRPEGIGQSFRKVVASWKLKQK